MAESVEFVTLAGEHTLSGVDRESVRRDGDYEDASVLRFLLDGKTYVATEDPSDGYRSMLRDLQLVDGPPIMNTFAPVRVVGSVLARYDGDTSEILQFILVASGRPVLTIGTRNSDDYYPGCVLDFDPKVLGELDS